MEKKQIIIGGIAVIVIIILGLWTFYAALQWFQSLNASIAAALITASLGLIGLWYAQWQSKTRDIAESHRANKIEVYNVFFNLVEKYQTDKIKESRSLSGLSNRNEPSGRTSADFLNFEAHSRDYATKN